MRMHEWMAGIGIAVVGRHFTNPVRMMWQS